MPDSAPNTTDQAARRTPSVDEIRKRAEEQWQVRPCLWQCEVVQAVLRQDRDIVSVAATGMGKTLTFWMPLLFYPADHVQVVVTPLNLLGQQQVNNVEKLGLKGIFICSETATASNWHDIESGVYQVVIISPEQLMKRKGGFEKLAKNPSFRKRIISIIFDEGHCISTWSSFRPDYKEVGSLKYTLPVNIPRVITTATLTDTSLNEIKATLHLRSDKLEVLRCHNDRPNIHLTVKKIQSSLSSFEDLKFILNGYAAGVSRPHETFLVFFDNIAHSIEAHKKLTESLPPEDQSKFVWFNSDMTKQFKEEHIKKLLSGEIWGIFATDSFGMGLDLPNITLVVQWRVTCSLTLLWQRFGRAARDQSREGTAVLLAEKEFFDDEKEKKATRRAAAEAKKGQPTKRRKRADPANASMSNLVFVQERPDEDRESESSASEDDLPQIPTPTLPTAPNPAKRKRKGKRAAVEIEPLMDDFINAKLRRLRCRRPPVMKAFSSDKAVSKHRQCDSSNADGCPRCRLRNSRLCCDIHNSPEFRRFAVAPAKVPKAPGRKTLPDIEMDTLDNALYNSLDTWRENKTIELYGWGHFQDFGGGLVLPTDMLVRIVSCARESILSSNEDLERETRWRSAQRFGTEVMKLVQEVRPPREPTPPPLPPAPPSDKPTFSIRLSEPNSTVGPSEKPMKRAYACGNVNCRQIGHNIRSCPLLSEEERLALQAKSKSKQTKPAKSKENQPPAQM